MVGFRNWKKGIFSAFAGFSLLVLAASGLTSCKSSPSGSELPEVNPLALLDEDSSIYVRVPVSRHVNLASSIVSSLMPGVSTSDAKMLAERIEVLYAGLGTVQDRSRLQAAALGGFPSIALNTVLTKRNGWFKGSYSAVSSEEALASGYPNKFGVYSREDMDYRLSFCSAEEFAIAADIEPMLEQYALRSEVPDTAYASWLNVESDDILIYITRPGQYLRNLIGTTINGCETIYGSLSYTPSARNPDSYSGVYSLSMYIKLTDRRFMRGFMSALTVALGMMDGEVRQIDDTTIYISGLVITERNIVDMFTRDPVTGKHFRVDGDSIITE